LIAKGCDHNNFPFCDYVVDKIPCTLRSSAVQKAITAEERRAQRFAETVHIEQQRLEVVVAPFLKPKHSVEFGWMM
jgi:hypothetical protein